MTGRRDPSATIKDARSLVSPGVQINRFHPAPIFSTKSTGSRSHEIQAILETLYDCSECALQFRRVDM